MRFEARRPRSGATEAVSGSPPRSDRTLAKKHTLPHLKKSGGQVLFYGQGGAFLIGPSEERWDVAMLVRQSSVAAFLAFASDQGYLAGIGHRLAALEDSRLLPLVAVPMGVSDG